MGLSEDGYTLARVARALAVSRGNIVQARSYSEAQYGATALASRVLQKGVLDTGALGDSGDAAAASAAFIALGRARPSSKPSTQSVRSRGCRSCCRSLSKTPAR